MQTHLGLFHSVILFSLLLFSFHAYGQNHYPFVPHEEMQMEAFYNWGFIWVHAGNVDFSADTLTYQNKKCSRITATGTSLKRWSFIFNLMDNYRSIVALDGFKPLRYEKNTIEGGYWIHNIYKFNWEKQNLDVFTESKRHPAKDTGYRLNRPLYDVLTATYYLRSLNTDSLTIGDTISIPVISDGEFDTYQIVYAGIGSLRRRNEVLLCHVYKAVIAKSTFFSQKDPLVVFVSDDKRKLPVYVEANIVVGSIKAYLKPYLNFRAYKPNSSD